jgi:hypothetical protein
METTDHRDQSRFTLANLDEPRRSAIIDSLKQGRSLSTTAKLCQASEHTVQAVKESLLEADPEAYANIVRRTLAAKCAAFSSTALDRLGTAAKLVPLDTAKDVKEMGIAAAVAIDKLSALLGQPTSHSVVEHRVSLDSQALQGALDGDCIAVEALEVPAKDAS